MIGKIVIGILVLISLITLPFGWTWRRYRQIKKSLQEMDKYHYDR